MSTPVISANRSNSASERSAMRMLSSSANCARIPPADLLVEPDARESRSSSTTSRTPSRRRWKAVLEPSAPPPATTTSARAGREEGSRSSPPDADPLADVVVELAERRPVAGLAAAPLDQDLLLDREVVLRRGLDLDSRIRERIRRVHALQRCHQARPRRVLACLLEGVHERPGVAEPVHDIRVACVEARGKRRRVLPDDRLRELHAGRVRL